MVLPTRTERRRESVLSKAIHESDRLLGDDFEQILQSERDDLLPQRLTARSIAGSNHRPGEVCLCLA